MEYDVWNTQSPKWTLLDPSEKNIMAIILPYILLIQLTSEVSYIFRYKPLLVFCIYLLCISSFWIQVLLEELKNKTKL